ncbi:MAG TPA: hypothetical protein VFK01_12215 [Bradyrhizobium sp.]|nr:hypothetical protein [Bradyrhizobium sp.]
MQDQFLTVLGKNKVKAGALEVSKEKQIRIRDNNRSRWNLRSVDRLDVEVAERVRAREVRKIFCLEFAGVIHSSTAMVNEMIKTGV